MANPGVISIERAIWYGACSPAGILKLPSRGVVLGVYPFIIPTDKVVFSGASDMGTTLCDVG